MKSITIRFDGDTTVANMVDERIRKGNLRVSGAATVARCRPGDQYDEYLGAAIALARLYGKGGVVCIPQEKLKSLLEEEGKLEELRSAYARLETKYHAVRKALRSMLGREGKDA